MNLYRFEVTTSVLVTSVIIAAEQDEKAFDLVEIELEKYFLKKPDIQDISLYEKRRIRGSGAGYVLHEQETRSNTLGGNQ
ncbi:DUF3906 family protein [Mangrovibacillus sp. Mu-81]|uniref:DUF3906 family protein n=1 Tax=Mangrovibacillus sp. Mu-81 TaxID=3121478 RepID=UPI002FE4A194